MILALPSRYDILESKVKRLIIQVIIGILGLFIATKLIPGVSFVGEIKYLFMAGVVLGLLMFFVLPILKIITFPLRILTLGLFSIILNMFLVWLTKIVFPEVVINGLLPLFFTALVISGLNFITGAYRKKH